jgi:methionine-gamma-lyase
MSKFFDPKKVMDSVVLPPFFTSTYSAKTAEELAERFQILLRKKKGEAGFIYGRFGSPNSEMLENQFVDMEEEAKAALFFPSGMSAIFTSIFSLNPGQIILYTNPVYGCTEELFHTICAKYGIKAVAVDTSDPGQVEQLLKKYGQKVGMLFIETPANPSLKLSDIGALAELARQYEKKSQKIWVVVDNTFMGPVFQKPFLHGADIVIYSATKFIGGHSDLIAGVVLTKTAGDIKSIKSFRDLSGPTIGPLTCFLISRSLETLELRMKKQAEVAQSVAEFLNQHSKVKVVIFPGLLSEGSLQSEIYRKQCLGPGSMISFYLKRGGRKAAFRLLNALKHFDIAVSLGGTHSHAEHPKSTTHAAVPLEKLKAGGVTESLIRLSIGTEDPTVLIGDLKRALVQA